MAGNAVQPLRINKMSTPTSSPTKLPRPLTEIGTTERRRNSPSYNQATKKMIVTDVSPKETSPFRSSRGIWNRDGMSPGRFGQENSPERENVSPSKRSSIENLKKASRVANSPMFARESRDKYDPSSSPIVERPLTDRPLSDRIQQNPFARYDSVRKENNPFRSPERPTHRRTESRTDIIDSFQPTSPPVSPHKSSLTANSRYGNNALGMDMESSLEDDSRAPTPRQSLRPAKSVTFQTAPPEINEYEQQTPEPSSVASGSREGSYESDDFEDGSFDRASEEQDEDSFDASLEDTDKTPVVLPGDWRHASPSTARTDLVDEDDDVFDEGSPPPTATPSRLAPSQQSTRSESVTSEGSVRPLPPLPGFGSPERGRRSSASLTAAAERASSAQRVLPTPPRPASISKDEILRMREGNMTREDRMSLLALQESLAEDTRRNSVVTSASTKLQEATQDDADAVGDLPEFDDYAPQISRESILKKVKADLNQDYDETEQAEQESLYSEQGIDYSDLARLDPDTAIPSRENSSHFNEADVPIKEEPEESVLDLDHIPVLSYDPAALAEFDSPYMGQQRQSSVVHHSAEVEDQDQGAGLGISDNEKFSTPAEEPTKELNKKTSLPFLANFLGKSEYDFGLTDYMSLSTPSTEKTETEAAAPALTSFASGLRTSLSSAGDNETAQRDVSIDTPSIYDEPVMEEAPVIPERKATIKTGGKLKARRSGTTSDLEAVIQAQREAMEQEPMPDMPEQYRPGSNSSDNASVCSGPSIAGSSTSKNDSAVGSSKELKLDLPLSSTDSELGNLSAEMERLMESQKKGYLMRQNTKVVHASHRNFSNDTAMSNTSNSSAPSTTSTATADTRKISTGEKFIQTEPWNGKMRRKSGRTSSSGRRSNIGMAPPVPGHESALGTLDEHSILSDLDADAERGRLFVKVMGVKDLDLPLPRNDRLFFQLTLDNGLHCVTTANLDLGRNAPIGQEFELVVQQELEFQLTLTTVLPPKPKTVPSSSGLSSAGSASSGRKSPTKSMFSRLLSSPKKRAEAERRAQMEAEAEEKRRVEEAERRRMAERPTTWDKLRELVDAQTGSFARAYVGLKGYEEGCYGRPMIVDVPLYNEWAMEKDFNVVSSVRSKRSNGFGMGMRDGVVRRPPYQVGALEVQLLYVPRGKGMQEEDMPKSMSAAIREMKEAEKVKAVKHEGYLSQQGGDCPYWRRRFFRLSSTRLTAYHEHTMQPRATINLSKASKLIDDKTSLVADPNATHTASKKRRKSAFAEEDEGYQFVEEGFRLRFSNGETIDFYADTAAQKDEWMGALSQAIGRPGSSGSKVAKWTDLVLTHESRTGSSSGKSDKDSAKDNKPEINVCPPSSSRPSLKEGSGSGYTKSAPNSPVKRDSVVRKEVPRNMPVVTPSSPAVPPKDEGSWFGKVRPSTPPMTQREGGRSRKAVKSMIL
ncbi:PH domain-containing protein 1 [Elsinoe australis]|uniref:PH domain-containing protein 1 n=1 Tax=Elsinoe australis TaxID=40998 RepID=A0A4U7BE73_9PEZI|nr:PH domain-containing protein 1 [Elsinoe australis]